MEGVGLNLPGRDPLDLGDGMWVVFDMPFDLPRHWEQWLGELETQRLRRCNLSLIATSASPNPSVLDAENEMLTQRVLSLHYSLFMIEIFRCQRGLGLSGANVDGQIEVRQVRQIEPHYSPDRFAPVSLTRDHFSHMARVAEGIRAVHIPGTEVNRLQKGFHAWIRAVQERYGDERLHQFVRAIEAVLKPSQGKVKRQFAHRCQLFVGESPLNEKMLTEIVNMRGLTEHLNPMEHALEGYPEANRRTISQQRLCQVQLLASYVYAQILSDRGLRELFASDAQITTFWQLLPDERRARWPSHLDWVRLIASRYLL